MIDDLNKDAIIRSVIIKASASNVWNVLTKPELIKQWMLDTEMNITTNWQAGSPIIFQGSLAWTDFENKGTILQFEPGKVFRYNYLSTLSNLPDVPENYTIVGFELSPLENKTILVLTLHNFPNEVIYKHLDFYWTVTLDVLKKLCERL